MRTIILLCISLLSGAILRGQAPSVESSTFGIQIGAIGAWGYYEAKIADPLALRFELGTNTSFSSSTITNGNLVYVFSEINVEPRFYYNLNRRSEQNKSIAKNSADFLSLRTRYIPDLVVASNSENINIDSSISILPSWGIRRSVGTFNYELGFGIGYGYRLESTVGSRGFVAGNLQLRVGLGW